MSIVFYTEEEQVIYKNINSQLLSFNRGNGQRDSGQPGAESI